ncbi:MAG: rhamnose transport system permease protein [Solirubrobacteraceae bacterium]|nr:rhamnose transport system permease protein [Solirubrobacteraceae bacterium]
MPDLATSSPRDPAASAAGAADGAPPRGRGGAAALLRWEVLIAGLILVTCVVGQAISSQFLTTDSFTTGSLDLSEIALMALPLALVIVAAEIDLSIASVLGLSSAVMAYLWNQGLPIELIAPICIVVGGLCGAFNGLLVTRLGLPSLAVTIGTLALFRGLAFVVIGDASITDFPTDWTDRAFGNFAGTFVPNTIVLFAVLAVAFAVLLHATPFGRSIFAVGANEEAAWFSGLRVKRIKLTLFILSGAVAGLAGVVISLRNSTAAANVGTGFELTTVAAVVLGGVSIFGGRGTIGGVVLALLLLGGIQKALTLSDSISSYWIQIVTGALLIGSVLGPNLVQRAREARSHASRSRGSWPPRLGPDQARPLEEDA